jgi:20S proteasome alpha/beta subunit
MSCSPSYSLDNRGHRRQDCDPILRRYQGDQMTFTYACLSEGGIVLAADSQVTFSQHDEERNVVGTYLSERSKIRRIGKHSAFSIAGRSGLADAILEALELDRFAMQALSFDEALELCGRIFNSEIMKRGNSVPAVDFMFCGYADVRGTRVPRRVILSSGNRFSYRDVSRYEPAWTGAVEHGAALYLHHRFHPRERLLSLEQAKFLAYCIVKEVADMDNTVGGQIEMEVITELGSKPFTDIERFENKRKILAETIRSAIESA